MVLRKEVVTYMNNVGKYHIIINSRSSDRSWDYELMPVGCVKWEVGVRRPLLPFNF